MWRRDLRAPPLELGVLSARCAGGRTTFHKRATSWRYYETNSRTTRCSSPSLAIPHLLARGVVVVGNAGRGAARMCFGTGGTVRCGSVRCGAARVKGGTWRHAAVAYILCGSPATLTSLTLQTFSSSVECARGMSVSASECTTTVCSRLSAGSGGSRLGCRHGCVCGVVAWQRGGVAA